MFPLQTSQFKPQKKTCSALKERQEWIHFILKYHCSTVSCIRQCSKQKAHPGLCALEALKVMTA